MDGYKFDDDPSSPLPTIASSLCGTFHAIFYGGASGLVNIELGSFRGSIRQGYPNTVSVWSFDGVDPFLPTRFHGHYPCNFTIERERVPEIHRWMAEWVRENGR